MWLDPSSTTEAHLLVFGTHFTHPVCILISNAQGHNYYFSETKLINLPPFTVQENKNCNNNSLFPETFQNVLPVVCKLAQQQKVEICLANSMVHYMYLKTYKTQSETHTAYDS